jgi:hypothetical protein
MKITWDRVKELPYLQGRAMWLARVPDTGARRNFHLTYLGNVSRSKSGSGLVRAWTPSTGERFFTKRCCAKRFVEKHGGRAFS